MNQNEILKTSILLFLIIGGTEVLAVDSLSPLRLCDSPSCDVTLTYQSSVYNLSIPLTLLKNNGITSFCMRQRSFSNSTNGTCQLGGYNIEYNCQYIQSNGLNMTSTNFKADASLTYINNSNSSGPNLELSLTRASLSLNTKINKIYEFVMGVGKNLIADTNYKLVFFHTFRNASNVVQQTGNLFMQRYFVCYQYYVNSDYNYNLIFYGGVQRNGKDTMYISFVSFLSSGTDVSVSNKTLNIWGALDFSTSHASRDIVGFSSGYANVYDLFSLYAAAPFNDTAININGTMDYVQIYSSYTFTSLPFFVATGGYRYYDTLDANGDEIIRKKINYKWCYAVGYSTSTIPITPDGNVKHTFVDCWTPNVVVWQTSLKIGAGMLIMLLIFFVIL